MKTSDMHYLKKAGLGFSACAAILLSSCETPFYIHTQVNPDLSVRRTCYSDSSLIPEQTPPRLRMDFNQPNPVHVKHLETDSLIGFYGESIPVNMKINTDYARIEDAKPFFRSVPPDGNPMFEPKEQLGKRFKWFYTYYTYHGTIRQIEGLPVSLSDFLSAEEQSVFFGNAPLPQGWIGVEAYEYLDELNTKFVQWYNKSLFETNFAILYSLADTSLRKRMLADKDIIYNQLKSNEIGNNDELADFCREWDERWAKKEMTSLYRTREAEADSLYQEKTKIIRYFSYVFVYRMDLPGKIVESNALRFEEGHPVWKVDGYRLLKSQYLGFHSQLHPTHRHSPPLLEKEKEESAADSPLKHEGRCIKTGHWQHSRLQDLASCPPGYTVYPDELKPASWRKAPAFRRRPVPG